MHEVEAFPFFELPAKESKVSRVADYTLLTIFSLGALADFYNDLSPHSLDFISPLIENHVGNFSISTIMYWHIMVWGSGILSMTLGKEKTKKMRPLFAIGAFACVVATNMIVEGMQHPNPEFKGDVLSGVIGAAIGLVHLSLPDRVEHDLARWTNKIKNTSK